MQVLKDMRTARVTWWGMLVLTTGLLVLAGCSSTKDAVKIEDLTGVEKVFAQYIEASGGRAVLESFTTFKTIGKFNMPAMGLTATISAYNDGQKSYALIESDALGRIENGSDGETYWEITTMGGARIKEGEERAFTVRSSDLQVMLHWEDYYTAAELVGQEEIDGVLCDKVVMTPKIGKPETTWYGAESHLVVKSSATISNEMGDIPLDIYPSDYREVDGFLMPFAVRQVVMSVQEFVITTDSVETGIEIPEGTFDLPEDIKALMQ